MASLILAFRCKRTLYTISPQFESQGLINFTVQNHQASNRERVEIETLLIWIGKLTRVQFETRAVFEKRFVSIFVYTLAVVTLQVVSKMKQ